MKSHACHVFMQELILVTYKDLFSKEIWDAFIKISYFFRDICSNKLHTQHIEQLRRNTKIICKLKMIFDLSFFDSMSHLPIYLIYEANVKGYIQYIWMYPFKRLGIAYIFSNYPLLFLKQIFIYSSLITYIQILVNEISIDNYISFAAMPNSWRNCQQNFYWFFFSYSKSILVRNYWWKCFVAISIETIDGNFFISIFVAFYYYFLVMCFKKIMVKKGGIIFENHYILIEFKLVLFLQKHISFYI